jgi:hypothetical protein
VAITFASPAPAISIGAEAPIKHSPAINPNKNAFFITDLLLIKTY